MNSVTLFREKIVVSIEHQESIQIAMPQKMYTMNWIKNYEKTKMPLPFLMASALVNFSRKSTGKKTKAD